MSFVSYKYALRHPGWQISSRRRSPVQGTCLSPSDTNMSSCIPAGGTRRWRRVAAAAAADEERSRTCLESETSSGDTRPGCPPFTGDTPPAGTELDACNRFTSHLTPSVDDVTITHITCHMPHRRILCLAHTGSDSESTATQAC